VRSITVTYVLYAQVIYTQGFILAFMINAFLRKIFFGTLRAAELEVSESLTLRFLTSTFLITLSCFLQHLVEKIWYAVTETCLAFTVFRDDFSPKFIALFTLLLFLKSFHWLAEDRVDYVSFTLFIIKIYLCSVN